MCPNGRVQKINANFFSNVKGASHAIKKNFRGNPLLENRLLKPDFPSSNSLMGIAGLPS